MPVKQLLSILVFFISIGCLAQFSEKEQNQLDSLNAIINNPESHDTLIASTLNEVANRIYLADENKALELCELAKSISEKGIEENKDSAIVKSFMYSLTDALGSIGYLNQQNGKIEVAIKYFTESLKLNRELNDTWGLAMSLNNLGMVYQNQGDFDVAIDYYSQSLKMRIEIKDTLGMSMSYNNLGLVYQNINMHEESLENYNKSLNLSELTNNKNGIAITTNNIGQVYYHLDQLEKAIEYYEKSLKIKRELGYKAGEAMTVNNIGYLYLEHGYFEEAEAHLLKAYSLAKEVGSPRIISLSASNLYKLNKVRGDFKSALTYYEIAVQMKDSIKNEETQKAAIRQQTKYEFEKAQLVKEQEEIEAARVLAEQTSRRNNLQYSMIFLSILLFFGLVLSLGFIKVSPTIAEGLIFFAFLIFFEFLLVLMDPFIEQYTGGEPIYKLIANAVLAGAIFPLHAFFERVLKQRLIKSKSS